MSLIPEFILQTVLARGMKAFRDNHRYIDQLFRNYDVRSVDQIRTFIKENAVDLCINYPKDTVKVPAIVILLKNESEAQAYLADSMGIDFPDIFSFDGGIDGETLGGTASVSSLSGYGMLVFGPVVVEGGTINTVEFDSDHFAIDNLVGQEYTVRIVAGTGKGQIRNVESNTLDTITVTPNWKIPPDGTSIVEVRAKESEVLGQPSALFDRTNDTPFIERRGALYNVNYQVQIIGPNPELTIALYNIVKSILFVSKTLLEEQGVINLKVSGTDFLPKPEYQPELSYMRGLNLEFIAPFDIFEDVDPLINEINLIVEGLDALIGEPVEIEA